MYFAKTVLFAVLGFSVAAFAAPIETNEIGDLAFINAASKDICDRIPSNEKGRKAECERDRKAGRNKEVCKDIPKNQRPRQCK